MNKISFPFGLLILFCTAAFAEDNLKDDFSGKPWGTWKANGMIASGCLDKTTGRTAPGSLKITLGPDCPLNGSICFIRRLPITPGKSYTASVWYRTKGTDPSVNVSLGFQGLDAKGQFLNNGVYNTKKTASDEWSRLICSVWIPAQGGKWDQAKFLLCTLGVSHSAEGEIWFDDFEFQLDDECEDD